MARASVRTRVRASTAVQAPASTGRTRTGRRFTDGEGLERATRDALIDGLMTSSKKFESQAIKDTDSALSSFGGEYVIETPAFNLMALAALVNKSNTLQQCIDAYVTNIESTGHQLVYIGPEPEEEEAADEPEEDKPADPADPEDPADPNAPPVDDDEPADPKKPKEPVDPNAPPQNLKPKPPVKKKPPKTGPNSPEALAEKERIESFLSAPNGEYSFIELRERGRRDRETIGGYVWEVVRDDAGEISAVYHTPSHTMFMTKRDVEATEVTRWVRRGDEQVKVTRHVNFRRMVQVVGGKRTYFKEFGDPRVMSSKTGNVEVPGKPYKVPDGEVASEIIYEGTYKSGYVYGVPRYIHQLSAIEGSRESELTNLDFFKNNAIPAMMAAISGGQLTQESLDDLKSFMTGAKGKDAANRFLLLEVEASAKGASPKGALQPPRVDLKALGQDRQSDALFQEYDKENQKKVRSAFRLPPLFLGLSEDLNYASAKASLELSEQQVFAPERTKVDDVINYKLLTDAEGKPPMYWWVKSNPAKIVDPTDIINALDKLSTVGALTPNMAITIANELFGMELDPILHPWGDIPFEATKLLMAKGMVTGFDAVLGEIYPPPAPPGFGGPPGSEDNPDEDPDPDAPPGDGKAPPFGKKKPGKKPPAKEKPPATEEKAAGVRSVPARKAAGEGMSPTPAKRKASVRTRRKH